MSSLNRINKLVSLFCLFVALDASMSLADVSDIDQQTIATYNGRVVERDNDNLSRLIASARALDGGVNSALPYDNNANKLPSGEVRKKKRFGNEPANVSINRRSQIDNDHEQQFGLRQQYPTVSNNQEDQKLQQQRAKWALKKRLHKMVEDMVEDRFPESGNTNKEAPKQMALIDQSSVYSSKPNYDLKRKRWHAQDENEKFMILMNRPSNYLDLATPNRESDLQQEGSSLNSALMNYISGQQQQQAASPSMMAKDAPAAGPKRPLVNIGEHARRVMDDKFGIMRDSIFTTNNHLGLKGVPKFGSDEEY